MQPLTPAQQDYLEAIFRLDAKQPGCVRITDIAAALGTRLPTVVRNVRRLRESGLVRQEQRGPVTLTEQGSRLGAQLAHRHADVVSFLVTVLGVSRRRAESEACILEHALSGQTAQQLHQFLEQWDQLEPDLRSRLAPQPVKGRNRSFTLVGPGSGPGGRS